MLRQQRWDRDGHRHESELPIEYRATPAEMFDNYVERYRLIAEEADGIPAAGQLLLPGVS